MSNLLGDRREISGFLLLLGKSSFDTPDFFFLAFFFILNSSQKT